MKMNSIFSYEEKEPVGILPEIQLISNTRAVIDSVTEIAQYTPESIKLVMGKISVCFSGSDLEIVTFDCERVTICGTVLSLSFSS